MFGSAKTPLSMGMVLRYHEKKVAAGRADCIYAGNFLKATGDLTRYDKARRFTDLIKRNTRTDRNVLHLFLVFNPGELVPKDLLIRISRDCMKQLGFGAQPYLVYQHHDAANPHLHIVSTNIRPDGSRIDMHGIYQRHAKICRELTAKYALAETKTPARQQPVQPRALKYGVDPSYATMSATLQYIIEQFHYRSIEELNAILRLYNIIATPGLPGSNLRRNNGLLYKIVNAEGKTQSAPFRAKDFPFKPTLKNLGAKFEASKTIDPASLSRIRRVLQPLITEQHSHPAETLRRSQLSLAEQPGGIFVIDLADRVVVTAADLGPAITPEALRSLASRQSQTPAETATQTRAETQTQQQEQQQRHSRHL